MSLLVIWLVFLHHISFVVITANAECVSQQPLVINTPNDNIFASIGSNDDHPPHEAKTDSGDAWCSVEIDNTVSPYIQVNFTDVVEIHSIAVGGHTRTFAITNRQEYVNTYEVLYRPVGGHELQLVVVDGDEIFPRDRNVELQRTDLPSPIITEILQIKIPPGSWISANNRVCITLEAYGCVAPLPLSPNDTVSTLSPSMVSTITTPQLSLSLTSSQIHDFNHLTLTSQQILSSTETVKSSLTYSAYNILPLTGSPVTTTNIVNIHSSQVSQYSRYTSTLALILSSPSASIDSSNINREQSQQDNLIVVYGSSAGVGVVVMVVLVVILVAVVLVCVVVNRRSKLGLDGAHHRLDNQLYGADSEHYEMKIAGTTSFDTKLEMGNIYEAVDEVNAVHGDSLDKNTSEDYEKMTSFSLLINNKGNEDTYETMGVGEKLTYDYVDNKDLTTPTTITLDKNAAQKTNPHLKEVDEAVLDELDVKTSLNPLYSSNTIPDHTTTIPTSNADHHDDNINNPLYSGTDHTVGDGTCDNDLSDGDDSLCDNPLYGGNTL